MKRFGHVVFSVCLLAGCNTNNQSYHEEVENQAYDIVEKVQYDERKLKALEKNTRPPLEIRDETINITQSVITQDRRIKDAMIQSDSQNVHISILVDERISNNELAKIGEKAAQQLSSFSEGGRPIKEGEIGELYDFYHLSILIGKTKKEPLLKGIKSPTDDSISWKM